MKNNITILIHTSNEEKNIGDCILSAQLLSHKIIVIDMKSIDKTVAIAKSLNTEVINFPQSNFVEPSREFGIKQAKTNWVLILDADERMTKELTNEIKNTIRQNQSSRLKLSESVKSGKNKTDLTDLTDSTDSTNSTASIDLTYYKIPRKNIFAGVKWLAHGGWWPDYQIRLINKNHFISWPKQIHSTPKIKGQLGYLNNPLVHYFHNNLKDMVKKTLVFEDIESELLYKAGKKANTKTFFRKYIAELFRRLIKNLGFLDGTFGFIESIYQAFSKTITYLFLYEKQNRQGRSL
jgi:glycosyltransferase involved in cell wall biosynthesis